MVPESSVESEEEQVPLVPADGEPASSDVGLPAGTPADTGDPSCSQDAKPCSAPVVNQQLAPEALDPRALKLLWKQKELEIQSLRWALQNDRHCHILQEVAGIPPERSYCAQEKFLQNRVQKLTLDLKAQKEQAQLEKELLEKQLMQTLHMVQQLEDELQNFQKSCLLHLAHSSWVGRILRSQTGSVEVITAETLMEPSDFSDNEQTGEGFRLEDVDWNSIARRFPNLLTNIKSSVEQRQPQARPPPSLDTWSLDYPDKHLERPGKNLEWSSLPVVGTSSSEGTDTDSNHCQPILRSQEQKGTGYPAQATDLSSSEQIQAWTDSFSKETEDRQKPHSGPLTKTVLKSYADVDHQCSGHQLSQANWCLKIAAVNCREKFVRILNQSLEETVDLGGFLLQQLVQNFPVCMFRFPPGTLLAPRHHITVWGERTRCTKKQPAVSLGQEPFHFHSSQACVTLLLNAEGQVGAGPSREGLGRPSRAGVTDVPLLALKVLSEHQAPHDVTLGSRTFEDNMDWSIDCFPLSEAGLGTDTHEQQRWPSSVCKGRVSESRSGRRKPGTLGILPRLSTRKPCHPGRGLAQWEGTKTGIQKLLPTIPEAGPRLENCLNRREHKFQVCRKSVDRSCPMVALSVQSTAESKYGFRFLCCPPITTDVCRRM
ncbi:lamin tail domain-containing protein 2 isoform X2 [Perognathus longimembris pacificus]|uniref:lamin tail domain-containing protein 2 isoform X2 n=1 Tax=Perognathus longimembris pacificus TaxID=214514 RepID=UPI0020188FEB|nr:lamin tail domain-containing protein 2 isoform X2 [Perognathus longimembris pacificus]